MRYSIRTNKKAFTLRIGIESPVKQDLKILATGDDGAIYVNRIAKINQPKSTGDGYFGVFDLKFPVSPITLGLDVYGSGNTDNFSITSTQVRGLDKYAINMNARDHEFMQFITWFAQNYHKIDSEKPDGTPTIYISDGGNFQIHYYDVMRDQDGKPLTTPMQVGAKTGKIEIAKQKIQGYSVPQVIGIGAHEYSHKFKNPTIGRSISDETAADINGLYLYLGNGWSENEVMKAYLKVFDTANNESNHKRMLIIHDFVRKFKRGEVAAKR